MLFSWKISVYAKAIGTRDMSHDSMKLLGTKRSRSTHLTRAITSATQNRREAGNSTADIKFRAVAMTHLSVFLQQGKV